MESCQVKRSDGLELNVKPPACCTSLTAQHAKQQHFMVVFVLFPHMFNSQGDDGFVH